MIKKIDGKVYIRLTLWNCVIGLLATVLLGVLVYTLVYAHTNIELIKTDPFVYGAIQHNISTCTCYAGDKVIDYRERSLTQRVNPYFDPFSFNLSPNLEGVFNKR